LEVNAKGENATETDVLEHLASCGLAVAAMAREAGLQGRNCVLADAAITRATDHTRLCCVLAVGKFRQ
jgi:hypothetical protein